MEVRLLYFSAAWCGPCKTQWPTTERAAKALSVSVEKVDFDTSMSVAQSYNIRSIPTLIILKGGQEVGRHTGTIGEEALKNLVITKIN